MTEGDKAETTPLNSREAAEDATVIIDNDFEDGELNKSANAWPNGEADVQPMEVATTIGDFSGLSKKELMVFAKDPFWVKIRLISVILFWLSWFGMLVAAVVIIVFAPKCAPRPEMDWWQTSVGYQVYPRSFKDSNGDGKGDFKGIDEKLDYIKDYLNASLLLINPIYECDVNDEAALDYMTVDADFGTQEELEALITKLHKKGMKVVIDFVPNHTSKKHNWFKESRKNQASLNAYRDYYVWTDRVGGSPANNWLSTHDGSAWEYDSTRGQYYLHQFGVDEPDLNLRNDAVLLELENAIKHWLGLGVDGIRVKAADYLFESAAKGDEKLRHASANKTTYDSYIHDFTMRQPESYELITKWRGIVDSFATNPYNRRLLIVETTEFGENSYVAYNDQPGAHLAFNLPLTQIGVNCTTACLQKFISSAVLGKTTVERLSTTWALGNDAGTRLASRVGVERVVGLNMMLLTLPGIPFVYYGDEIGMQGPSMAPTKPSTPISVAAARFNMHSPMQWTDQANGGFCDGCTPWQKFGDDKRLINMKTQRAAGSGTTALEMFAVTSVLRREPSFAWGGLDFIDVGANMLAYTRVARGYKGFLVAFNFGNQAATPDFYSANDQLVSEYGTIMATTANVKGDRYDDFKISNRVRLDGFFLKPNEGVIFQLE